MHGPAHKDLRRKLLPLFTKKALRVYVAIQEKVTREHISKWIKEYSAPDFQDSIQNRCRLLNSETSLRVFIGNHVDDDIRKRIGNLYFTMTQGFLGFPINLPGFALNRAIQARKEVVKLLEVVVVSSKQKMATGGIPDCLLDFWCESLLRDGQDDVEEETKEHFSDYGMACTVLDFLFASQDASTSSLVWAITLLEENPDMLRRVREEQLHLRPTLGPLEDVLENLVYTKMVVKELLRFRPPAVMVPHEAVSPFQLTEDYVVPKGTILLPSIWCAQKEGFTNPDVFDPERFNEERREDVVYAKHYLAFGIGPHRCMGKEYAYNHLSLFVSLFSTLCDWERIKTKESDKIIYSPTIYPADGCIIKLRPRSSPSTAH
eukprot:Sdes_comp10105_c0_seq1m1709